MAPMPASQEFNANFYRGILETLGNALKIQQSFECMRPVHAPVHKVSGGGRAAGAQGQGFTAQRGYSGGAASLAIVPRCITTDPSQCSLIEHPPASVQKAI